MVRAKFVCMSVNDFGNSVDIELYAVHDGSAENKAFWKYTPGGNIKLSTVNKAASEYFKPQVEYYIDFTKAE